MTWWKGKRGTITATVYVSISGGFTWPEPGPLPATVTIGVWVPVTALQGAPLEKTFDNPEELWKFLHALVSDPKETLKLVFGWTPPPDKAIVPTIDLSDLELDI